MADTPNAQSSQSGNFDWINALLGGGLGYLTASQNGLNNQQIGQGGQAGQAGLSGILSGNIQQNVSPSVLQSYNNPYLNQSIQAGQQQTLDQFKNQILPQISDTFQNAGSFGSGRQAALTGTATQNVTNKLADIDAQQRSNAYNAAYTAAVNAGGQNFVQQANAANTLYTAATNIAQQAPWLQALGAGIVGGTKTGTGTPIDGIRKLYDEGKKYLTPLLDKIKFNWNTPGEKQYDGSIKYPTSDGGYVLKDPSGNIYVHNKDGTYRGFDKDGNEYGVEVPKNDYDPPDYNQPPTGPETPVPPEDQDPPDYNQPPTGPDPSQPVPPSDYDPPEYNEPPSGDYDADLP